MIALTSAAASKIRALTDSQAAAPGAPPIRGIRVMVVGGGCSGLNYDMDFAEATQDGDLVFETEGVQLFVDPTSFGYLDGTKIDYVESMTFNGFHFDNPNEQQHGCSCGSNSCGA